MNEIGQTTFKMLNCPLFYDEAQMFKRSLTPKLKNVAAHFPVVTLLGPRQAGKTTLVRSTFPQHTYISLEKLDVRDFALSDARGFLETYAGKEGVIIDEVQHAPGLLSYIQTKVDEHRQPGCFILTGSQNLLVNQSVAQTLAGRTSLQTLLPFTLEELRQAQALPDKMENALFNGFYPSIYAQKVPPADWYSSYIRTYVERDVRQIKNITDLRLFQTFLKLCAGRIGQLLNISSLANDCGIGVSTAKGWLSLLEASYLIFLLQPHYKNFSKRLVKSPKLYFYDTGLACSLLGLETSQSIATHYLRGGLFESMIISDLIKQRYNVGLPPNIYFWRDKLGHEVDCIIDKDGKLIPIEIKAGMTISSDYFQSLGKWCALAETNPANGIVIYAGDAAQKRQNGQVIGWQNISDIG